MLLFLSEVTRTLPGGGGRGGEEGMPSMFHRFSLIAWTGKNYWNTLLVGAYFYFSKTEKSSGLKITDRHHTTPALSRIGSYIMAFRASL